MVVPARACSGSCHEARHGIKMGRASPPSNASLPLSGSCRADGSMGPIVPGRSEVWIDFHIFIFLIIFMFLITKLFNIIKFKLKIYYFTLNNIIKIFYIIFLLGRCAWLIGPSWAWPNDHAGPGTAGQRRGPGIAWCGLQTDTTHYLLCRAVLMLGQLRSCFTSAHLIDPDGQV
jgi:hypothetical protein